MTGNTLYNHFSIIIVSDVQVSDTTMLNSGKKPVTKLYFIEFNTNILIVFLTVKATLLKNNRFA